MKQDEIIEMAKEAGLINQYGGRETALTELIEDFAKLVADKARQELREEIIYTWVPPHFVDLAIESCAEKAWIALVKHKQPWNVRQDVTDAIRKKGEA
jgi:hypothetical protein